MVTVLLEADSSDTRVLRAAAASLRHYVSFLEVPGQEVHDVVLAMDDSPAPALFRMDRRRGVVVSTWQSEGICLYAGIERGDYLLLCTLLGLTQWQALDINPILVAEDFEHPAPSRCLFSTLPVKQDYALLFEEPHVCPTCLQFYRCLGAEMSVMALQQALRRIHMRHTPLAYAARTSRLLPHDVSNRTPERRQNGRSGGLDREDSD